VTNRERNSEADSAPVGRISSRRVYTGRVVSLDVDKVRFPNGTEGELEMIRHPGASAVVPLLEMPDGGTKVILIRQYRYAAEGYIYEVPAGRLDDGESPEACAHRELEEETGYTATGMTHLTTIFTTPGFTNEKIHLFLATGLTSGQSRLEDDEVLDIHPVALREALEMIRSGAICDGKTISSLLFATRFKEIE
jgi:ADP-ribose pyrophosphatase